MTQGRLFAPSVNDFVRRFVGAFQVRNFQGAHGLNRPAQDVVGAAAFSHGLSRGPQDPQDLRPIESLPFAMLAEAHTVALIAWPTRARQVSTNIGYELLFVTVTLRAMTFTR